MALKYSVDFPLPYRAVISAREAHRKGDTHRDDGDNSLTLHNKVTCSACLVSDYCSQLGKARRPEERRKAFEKYKATRLMISFDSAVLLDAINTLPNALCLNPRAPMKKGY